MSMQDEKKAPAEVSQAEFARMNGWVRSHVTGLKNADRLVMTEDGKRVKVAESMKRIKETEDPHRTDVKQRHADERKQKQSDSQSESKPALPPDREEVSRRKAMAVMRQEEAAADIKEAERRQKLGELVDVADVRLGGADLGAHVRQALENMADQLAPLLAPESDQERIHSMLVDAAEQVLTDMADKIGKLAQAK